MKFIASASTKGERWRRNWRGERGKGEGGEAINLLRPARATRVAQVSDEWVPPDSFRKRYSCSRSTARRVRVACATRTLFLLSINMHTAVVFGYSTYSERKGGIRGCPRVNREHRGLRLANRTERTAVKFVAVVPPKLRSALRARSTKVTDLFSLSLPPPFSPADRHKRLGSMPPTR